MYSPQTANRHEWAIGCGWSNVDTLMQCVDERASHHQIRITRWARSLGQRDFFWTLGKRTGRAERASRNSVLAERWIGW